MGNGAGYCISPCMGICRKIGPDSGTLSIDWILQRISSGLGDRRSDGVAGGSE